VHKQSGWMPPYPDISADTSIIPTIFTVEALPAATFPIYSGLEQAQSMLGCIPGDWVAYQVTWLHT